MEYLCVECVMHPIMHWNPTEFVMYKGSSLCTHHFKERMAYKRPVRQYVAPTADKVARP
jgi:hypothetical protein